MVTKFPTLETPRLILRQLEKADAQNIFFLRADETVNKYLDDFKHHVIEQTQHWIETALDCEY